MQCSSVWRGFGSCINLAVAAPNVLTFVHPQVEVWPQHSVEHGEALLVRGEACPALVFKRSPHLVYPKVENKDVGKK